MHLKEFQYKLKYASAFFSSEKLLMILLLALLPSSLFSASSRFSACSMPVARRSVSDWETRKPQSPNTSLTPPESVATTTLSQAIASATTNPKPSHKDERTKISVADKIGRAHV